MEASTHKIPAPRVGDKTDKEQTSLTETVIELIDGSKNKG